MVLLKIQDIAFVTLEPLSINSTEPCGLSATISQSFHINSEKKTYKRTHQIECLRDAAKQGRNSVPGMTSVQIKTPTKEVCGRILRALGPAELRERHEHGQHVVSVVDQRQDTWCLLSFFTLTCETVKKGACPNTLAHERVKSCLADRLDMANLSHVLTL